MTQHVDLEVVAEAGRVYGRVYDVAAAAVRQLARVLKSSAGMGGSDDVGRSWCEEYDAVCGGRAGGVGLMEAATAAITGAAHCLDLLYSAEVNHRNADQQPATDIADAPAFSPSARPSFMVPAIPSAQGEPGDVPEWWHTIEAYVEGEMWPNGDPGKLRAAADAWHAAAHELRSAADLANNGVIGSVRQQKSSEFLVAANYCTKVRDSLKSVAKGFDAAGKACSDYARAVDDAQSKILYEMAQLNGTATVPRWRRLTRRWGRDSRR
jgi:hypothetical protein